MEDEAGALGDPVGGQIRRLLVDQSGDAVGLGHVDDFLDRGLVDLLVILVGDAQGDAHVVGSDEDAVDARDL